MPYATKITGSDNTVYDIKDVEARRNRVFCGNCSTAAGTATKVVTVDSDFTLAAGREIAVKFASANTAANPKLNVNSTGAISIYYQGDTIRSNVSVLSQNDYYTFFVYDGSNWVWAGQDEKHTAPIEYYNYQTDETNISFSEYESYQQVDITGSTHTFIIDMDVDNTFVNYLLVNNSGNSTCTIILQAANGMSWQRFIRPTDAIEVEPGEYIELSFISINYGDELVITKSASLERGSIS